MSTNPIHTQDPQQAAPESQETDESLPEDSSGGPINLHRAFAKLQEALTVLADESGTKRAGAVI